MTPLVIADDLIKLMSSGFYLRNPNPMSGYRFCTLVSSPFVASLCLSLLGMTATAFTADGQRSVARPNIIVIMGDDMGYSDIGCYGGEINTPNLDALAATGLRMTQFYNTARCCPTRASLLTGVYPHQAGVGWMMEDRGTPGYRGDLSTETPTIAEMLKPAGYATYMAGKWHVTPKVRPNQSTENWPRQRGFDRFYGTIHGAGSFFDPNSLTRENRLISPFADPEYQPETYYYTDAITDHATRYIDEHIHNQDGRVPGPFFLYVAYTAAHWPMHALPEDIAKYEGKYREGYGPIREARLKKMHELGLLDPKWKMTSQADDWSKVDDVQWEERGMEVYAAMVDRMDQGIGKIVAKLKETGQFENTLILFLQDNGGCAEGMGRGGKNQQRAEGPTLPAMSAEALQLDMIPRQTRDGYPVLQGRGVLPGPADTYIGYGRGWANVSNTPFREYKHWVHEGGISTPLIAHWPAGISRHGELEPTPSHLIDIAATCVDLGQGKRGGGFSVELAKPLEGVSLAPLFRGEKIDREAIYWEHEGNRAVRQGKWKLVAKENQPWELYDMEADRTETHNLAVEMPDRVQQMQSDWDAWAARANVLPLGGWKNKPAVRVDHETDDERRPPSSIDNRKRPD